MIIAFQIILLFIIFGSFLVMVGEKDKKSQENFMFICAIAIAIFFASEVWL